MELGFALPQLGREAGPDAIAQVAEKAEGLGYDSLWVLDRILWPLNPRDAYTASPDGRMPELFKSVLDPIETLSYAAALTRKVRLGTSVMVAPYQGPVLLGRRLATLDVLSGGRAICGLGVGWSRDEFEAIGVPFKNRDARMTELIEAMLKVWNDEVVEFNGRFYAIPPSRIEPKPIQRPHPPIYLAAHTPGSMKRAVQFADAWHPAALPSFDWLATQIKALHEAAREAGRDPSSIEICVRGGLILLESPRAPEGRVFSGTFEQIRADIKRAEQFGVSQIVIETQFAPGMTVATMLERLDQFRALA